MGLQKDLEKAIGDAFRQQPIVLTQVVNGMTDPKPMNEAAGAAVARLGPAMSEFLAAAADWDEAMGTENSPAEH